MTGARKRQEVRPRLEAHLLREVQQASPSSQDAGKPGALILSGLRGRIDRFLPVNLYLPTMRHANPVGFSLIVERRLLAYQLGSPFLSAPRTNNLHR